MKVLLVNGSPHTNGDTAGALSIVKNELNNKAIDTIWFNIGTRPIRGCTNCNKCVKSHRCIFEDDICNELIEAFLQADGIIVGSPVYFAGPNGALCALLDRVFYAASNYGRHFKGKPAAAVVSCWRAGATASIDRLNKYFTFSEMPIVSSNYWNMKFQSEGSVGKDAYGENIMKQLGINMAEILEKIEK